MPLESNLIVNNKNNNLKMILKLFFNISIFFRQEAFLEDDTSHIFRHGYNGTGVFDIVLRVSNSHKLVTINSKAGINERIENLAIDFNSTQFSQESKFDVSLGAGSHVSIQGYNDF